MNEENLNNPVPAEADQIASAPAVDATPSTPATASAEAESTSVDEAVQTAIDSAPVKVFYMGQEVVERLDEVNGDGRHCRLADGSTAYVPLSILGE